MRGTWLDEPHTAETKFKRFLVVLIVAATLLGVFVTKDIMEGASALLLVFTAMTTWRIFEIRRTPGTGILRDDARIWALISIGFAWLAVDEVVSTHEKIDELFHWLLGWEETYLSDRTDDMIVGVYGVIGVIVLYFHRREFTSLTGFSRYIVAGLILLAIMIVFDVLSDTPLRMWLPEAARHSSIKFWLSIGEEFTKLMSEGILLLGFVRALRQVSEARTASVRGAAVPELERAAAG